MVKPVDISPYVLGHKERLESADRKREKFHAEAMSKAKKIAEELHRAFLGVEVYLFGSLTTDFYELTSDIDLAIKGLKEEDYFKALKIAEEIAAPISVDLVQVEYAPEPLIKVIQRDGVSL
ncbi:putative nucleotidyltransferase [Desulfitobacterium dichloroeliminans LMG P-21439]|uniref:Putative nucleotidyltransferase n=1 Tax=Desulfitobacterium dichloroeliminans (strain LMG P-21439 / DCA1) TaxID=871963 RepID=L0F451_DESDL|nr:nucleotidyltransferase domain-containing protein [Desulfitobacterium dichloroeliminans]AGA67835.1 putative nucleotidyltransferase [Desulfitobacterium dichloroeliminans LMG P-21439]